MPRYSYKCDNQKCKRETFAEFLPLKDYNKKVKCPDCGRVGKKEFPTVPTHVSWSRWRAGS